MIGALSIAPERIVRMRSGANRVISASSLEPFGLGIDLIATPADVVNGVLTSISANVRCRTPQSGSKARSSTGKKTLFGDTEFAPLACFLLQRRGVADLFCQGDTSCCCRMGRRRFSARLLWRSRFKQHSMRIVS